MASYDHYTMLRLGLGRWSDHEHDPPQPHMRTRMTFAGRPARRRTLVKWLSNKLRLRRRHRD